MTSLEDVLAAAGKLADELDAIVEEVDDLWLQAQLDWIWYRLSTANVILRDRGGGPAAAVLARGLLEQAAYWDWALATGAGSDLVVRQTASELARLRQLADSIDDTTWTGWLLPPGVSVASVGTDGLPRNPAEAVKRLGGGLDEASLQPLTFKGVFSAYRVLEVLSHGGLAAASVLRSGGGEELTNPLAAVVAHVAATGAAASSAAQLSQHGLSADGIVSRSLEVARLASEVHGLPLGEPRRVRAVARSGPISPLAIAADIEHMPPAQQSTIRAAKDFLRSAERVGQAATRAVRMEDPGAYLIWPAFQMAWAQLHVLRGIAQGTLGAALLPFAARPIFEEGARWGWLAWSGPHGQPGEGLHAIVDDGRRRVVKIRNSLAGEDMPQGAIDHLLGDATDLLMAQPSSVPLPELATLLREGHPTGSGVESAGPIYSVLSQFVHATPVAVLHLQRDTFPSLTAPVFAVAVEATCRGFANTARASLAISCTPTAELSEALKELDVALANVMVDAARLHLLG